MNHVDHRLEFVIFVSFDGLKGCSGDAGWNLV